MKHTQHAIRETIIAGHTILRRVMMSHPREKEQRKPKSNPTRESVQKNNERIATRKAVALINANFVPGDYHVTLTYRGNPPEQQKAKKDMDNFIRRMKREYEKQDRELRYFQVTEYKHKRIHHHIVMSYIDEAIIRGQWKEGYVRFSVLDTERNYAKLAEYLVKETSKTFRDPENATKRRWRASKNLIRPVVKREIVSVRQLFEDPKPLEGYYIDRDSVRRYEYPFTELEHLEYIMVSQEPVPRIRKWRKGKTIRRDEPYRRIMDLDQETDGILESWGIL